MTSISEQIKTLETYIENIKQTLPYADGQAYYNDLRTIDEMNNRILALKIRLKENK